jgi:hypothetical protein
VIIGVDHIAISGADQTRDAASLEMLGFRRRFAQPGIPNPPQKMPFLGHYRPNHDIALFDAAEGVAVELIIHGGPRQAGTNPGFVPLVELPSQILDALPAHRSCPADVSAAICEAYALKAVRWARILALDAPIWGDGGASTSTSVKAVTRSVGDLCASAAFFCDLLGLKLAAQGSARGAKQWVRLDSQSPVARWRLSVLLCAASDTGEAAPMRLDQSGYPCLAFLSTDIVADAEKLAAHTRGRRSDVFDLVVDQKLLSILLAEGPSNELIEFIQVRAR